MVVSAGSENCKGLSKGTSGGTDFLNNELIPNLPYGVLLILGRLFSARMLNLIPRPSEWATVLMWCLLKTQDAKSLEDLRGIMILPVLLRLYMKVLLFRISPFIPLESFV